MSYKHSWDRPRIIPLDVFQKILSDFRKLVPVLEERGVELRDGLDQKPYLDEDMVCFEGRWPGRRERRTRHPFLDSLFPDEPAAAYRGLGSSALFYFPRVDRHCGGECQTNRYNYDLAVTCFLVIARHHIGEELKVWSDAQAHWWDVPRGICHEVLGYGVRFQAQPSPNVRAV